MNFIPEDLHAEEAVIKIREHALDKGYEPVELTLTNYYDVELDKEVCNLSLIAKKIEAVVEIRELAIRELALDKGYEPVELTRLSER